MITINALADAVENMPEGLALHMGMTMLSDWVCLGGLAAKLTGQTHETTCPKWLVNATGIPMQDARALCYPDSVSDTQDGYIVDTDKLGEITPSQVANCLRHYAATGMVSWGIAAPNLAECVGSAV